MTEKLNIALDGPAGAGKSTVAKEVADRLHILCLDTGAMYRALALKAIRLGIEPGCAAQVLPILNDTIITVISDNGVQHTFLDGEDVNALIRTQQVSRGASDISAIPEVREKLVECQQKIARENDVVMEGRDIGSVVMPWTENKFYVTASSAERAKRRLAELVRKGQENGKTLEEIQREIEERDYNDSHRAASPLTRLPDAVVVDTTQMSIEEAVQTVIAFIGRND